VFGGFPGASEMAGHGFHMNYQRIMGSALLFEDQGQVLEDRTQLMPLNYGKNLSDAFGVTGPTADIPFSSGLTPMNITGYVAIGDDIFLPIHRTNRLPVRLRR
jgi:hypothetical protein